MFIHVEKPEDIVGLKVGTQYTFNCKMCNKLTLKQRLHGKKRLKISLNMLCKKCLSIQSNRERYGTDYPAQNKEIYAKVKETNRKKYGVENVLKNEKIQEKIEATNLRKYGKKHHWESPEIREKIKRTIEDKYGSEYIGGSKEIQEKIKATMNAKYGVDNPLLVPEIKEKAIQSMIDKHGVPYSGMSKELFEKTKATKKRLYNDEYYNNHEKMIQSNLAKYDVEELLSAPEIREKIEETNLRKYGVKTTLLVPEVREKIKRTNLDTYGVEHPMQSPEIQEKIKQSLIANYGVDHPSKSPEIREKVRQTMLNTYGVDNIFKHPDFIRYTQKVRGRKYSYDGEKFDSSWELALWIYAKDHGEPIEREVEPLEYVLDGKTHYYYPDFKYKGELIEIKGSLFMDDDGVMVNVFNHLEDDLFAAKQQCAIANNVKFMLDDDMQFAINYAKQKFGNDKHWYKQFYSTPAPEPLQLTPMLSIAPMYIYPTIPMMLPWWMFMIPCDFNPYSMNVFEREGMKFVDCE